MLLGRMRRRALALAVCSALWCHAHGMSMSVGATARGMQLRSLCTYARVAQQLHTIGEVVTGAEQDSRPPLAALASTFDKETSELASRLRSMDRRPPPKQFRAQSYLTEEVRRLQDELDDQQREEERDGGRESRAREVFKLIDLDDDGKLKLADFQRAATTLLTSVSQEQLNQVCAPRAPGPSPRTPHPHGAPRQSGDRAPIPTRGQECGRGARLCRVLGAARLAH